MCIRFSMALRALVQPSESFLSKLTLPYTGDRLGIRAQILGSAHSLSGPSLMKALSIFSDLNDDEFFKQINKALIPKIKYFEFSDISSLLQIQSKSWQKSPGWSSLYIESFKRLQKTINRAAPSEVIELLIAISNNSDHRIAELCLNRYSLTKETQGERAVLKALCQFGLHYHGRTVRRVLGQLKFDPEILNPADAVEVFTYMHALSMDCSRQFNTMRTAIWENIDTMSSSVRASACTAAFSYRNILDPNLIVHASLFAQKDQAVNCMKHRLGLQVLALLEPKALEHNLHSLTLEELNTIWKIINDKNASEKPPNHFQCSLLTRKISVANLFSTLTVDRFK